MLTVPCNAASHEARKGYALQLFLAHSKALRASCQGNSTGQSNKAGLPEITGRIIAIGNPSGAFSKISNTNGFTGGTSSKFTEMYFNASFANNIYGSSSTVMPDSVSTSCVIYLGK